MVADGLYFNDKLITEKGNVNSHVNNNITIGQARLQNIHFGGGC